MSTRRLAVVFGAVVMAAAVTGATGRWQSKPFNTWTDVELKEVVTSSPWAGKGAITYVRSPGVDLDSGNATDPLWRVALVSWSSAEPLRQAAERAKFQAGTAVSPDVAARLAAGPDAFVIKVLLTNQPDFTTQAALMQHVTVVTNPSDPAGKSALMSPQTSLRTAGNPPLGPSRIEALIVRENQGIATHQRSGVFWQKQRPPSYPGRASLFIFTFPKTDRFTVAGAQIEFATKICTTSLPKVEELGNRPLPPPCNVNVKKTFMLKDMGYNGAPAL